MILVAATFAAVFGIVACAYWLFVVKPERAQATAVMSRLKTTRAARPFIGSLRKQATDLSTLEPVDAMLRRASGVVSPLQNLVEQSGARTTVARVLLTAACAALAAALGARWFGAWRSVALLAGVVAGAVPFLVLRYQRDKRLLKFEEQFPEALDLLARALRAGHAFTTGVAMVADEMPQPIGPEFRLLHDRQNFGMPISDALHDMARRVPVLDAKFFATAVLIQREAGGNLSEILDNLSGVIRERFRVKRQVRVISAHGRMTGWILGALPPALGVCFLVISDQHMETLFGHSLGQQMLMGAAALQVVGMLIIRKIVNIEY